MVNGGLTGAARYRADTKHTDKPYDKTYEDFLFLCVFL